MKDFKSFIIGFLSCACVFLLMGQTYGDKHLVKTTERLEAHSSTKLIDELREEESSLIAQKTITKDEG